MDVSAEGREYFADLGWLVHTADGPIKAVVEFDGREKYERVGAHQAQDQREEAILRTGARLIRFDGEDLLIENQHLVVPRLCALIPELTRQRLEPIRDLTPQPRRPRRRAA
ncbi:hypothetical protein [Mobilicoccus massiliensis]|uniref:hypothetical protein n=1 Tax=Mobilicoccus massiliensis TaxID=1522310 RepID=UPI001144F0BD|nr:hypothetical protein [Mobilicoccus massiliensis]